MAEQENFAERNATGRIRSLTYFRPMPAPLRVRRLGEPDAEAISVFMRSAGWNADATAVGVRGWIQSAAAQNPFEPGVGPPLVGVFVGPLLVACLTSIPTQFWNGSEFARGHWLKGFWVLEEHRDGLIGYLLLKEMLKHVGIAASMPAALAPRQLSIALGMTDLGAVRNYIQPLRIARILRRLDSQILVLNGVSKSAAAALRLAKLAPVAYALQALVGLGGGALRIPGYLAGRGLETLLAQKLPSEQELDSLWNRGRKFVSCCASRSGAYLRWRYQRETNGLYWFASCWRGAELVGIAVMQHPERSEDPRLAGLVVGSVVDLVFDPGCPGALPSLLTAARQWAKSLKYDALLLTMSHFALRGALIKAGYIPLPGNIHLMLRDPGGKHALSLDLGGWMVTRGDAWSNHL